MFVVSELDVSIEENVPICNILFYNLHTHTHSHSHNKYVLSLKLTFPVLHKVQKRRLRTALHRIQFNIGSQQWNSWINEIKIRRRVYQQCANHIYVQYSGTFLRLAESVDCELCVWISSKRQKPCNRFNWIKCGDLQHRFIVYVMQSKRMPKNTHTHSDYDRNVMDRMNNNNNKMKINWSETKWKTANNSIVFIVCCVHITLLLTIY